MEMFLFILGTAVGFAACWFLKDTITKVFTGTEAFATSLETKAAALKATIAPKL